jgi:hypothetical protein
MLRMMKTLPMIEACLALLILTGGAAGNPLGTGEGKEWLAWTPAERNVYVQGFIEGYLRGTNSACRLADELFEVGKPHRVGQGPRGRCEARLEKYTKIKIADSGPDLSAYTTVLTEFYTKHPEYQNIPKVYLLSFLTDRAYKTADQLSEMAMKREIRTHF